MTLTGQEAADFRAAMEKREREGNTPEQEAFLRHCEEIYLSAQKKLRAAAAGSQ